MRLDNRFKTKTMARIFVEQGQYRKAIQVYRYLLKTNPDQQDVKAELAAVSRKLVYNDSGMNQKDLEPLYRNWVCLVFGLCQR